MNRLGFSPAEFRHAYACLIKHPAIASVRVMTHLGCADVPNSAEVQAQLQAFSAEVEPLPVEKSAANGAALINYPHSHYDITRLGLFLYGVSPTETALPSQQTLQPVMTLKAMVVDTHRLAPVSYTHLTLPTIYSV